MSYEILVKRISPKLKCIAHKLDYRRTFFNAQDLYQEALLHLWNGFKRGSIQDKTDSYILQGCYFHLRNYLRLEKDKARIVSLDCRLMQDDDSEYIAMSIEDSRSREDFQRLDGKILAETIRNNGLTDKERHLLSLCAEGLTTREIGSRIGVSHVSVVKALAVIRRKCLKYRDNF